MTTHRPGLREATIVAVEQATGRLATQSVARMDEQLPWFRELPSDQRSWVTLVAQAGLQSFVEWLRQPDDELRLTGEVFAAAPHAMARSVTLQRTVELVRQAIAVAEANLPGLAGEADVATLREELLRFSREIAFAAARVYATAAENRGSWDRRLEALVIDRLISGSAVGDDLPSQLAALGWQHTAPLFAMVGAAPIDGDIPPRADGADGAHGTDGTDGTDAPAHDRVLTAAHENARQLGADVMAGVHGGRLVVVVGGARQRDALAAALLPSFGPGPVVLGPLTSDVESAAAVTRAALSGLRAAPAWPGAPRPVDADALLPERAIAGDPDAREQLGAEVWEPLVAAGGSLVETVGAYLDCGGALEATARALFVHANTVRYRLRRVAEVCGETPTDARGALCLRVALTLSRLK